MLVLHTNLNDIMIGFYKKKKKKRGIPNKAKSCQNIRNSNRLQEIGNRNNYQSLGDHKLLIRVRNGSHLSMKTSPTCHCGLVGILLNHLHQFLQKLEHSRKAPVTLGIQTMTMPENTEASSVLHFSNRRTSSAR